MTEAATDDDFKENGCSTGAICFFSLHFPNQCEGSHQVGGILHGPVSTGRQPKTARKKQKGIKPHRLKKQPNFTFFQGKKNYTELGEGQIPSTIP